MASILDSSIVPGNLRQQFIPFVLDPSQSINKSDVNSGSTGISPQVFSFRLQDITNESGLLYILPDDRQQMPKDIGFMSNFPLEGTDPMSTILSQIPGIQIREYTQDLKIDLIWDLVKTGIKGFQDGESASQTPDEVKKKQWTAQTTAIIQAFKENGFWNGLGDTIKQIIGDSKTYPVSDCNKNMFVITLAKALYYNMIGSTTTNIYVLPCIGGDSNILYNTDGHDGWPSENQFDATTKKDSIVGKMWNFIGGNVRIVTEPIWEGSKGVKGGISITFDLFNDTQERALHNFIFVNTIFPQNLFLQYHIFQQPPSVYDVKIEGGRRWFMCSGEFKCENKGMVRIPTDEFIKTLIDKHLNKDSEVKKTITEDYLKSNNVIKIPDIYEITLTFKSLLPDNFNNYIFQYSMNNNMTTITNSREEAFYNEGFGYIKSELGNIQSNVVEKAASEKEMKDVKNKAVELTQKYYQKKDKSKSENNNKSNTNNTTQKG